MSSQWETKLPPLHFSLTVQATLSEVYKHCLVLQNIDVVQIHLTSFKTSSYLELKQYQLVFLLVQAPCSIHPSPKHNRWDLQHEVQLSL